MDGIWFKRDDEFKFAGVRGGKVRSCWYLAQGENGLVTAGSRSSPQVNIVASIAAEMRIPCRVHTPEGDPSSEVRRAVDKGAVLVQHKAGYNNVIIARAREDAKRLGWRNIPFGMECDEAVWQTRQQVENIPRDVMRLVVPCGSGMSLAGILHGLKDNDLHIPVLVVVVGSDPVKRLNRFAPADWCEQVEIVQAKEEYHNPAKGLHECSGIKLDPIYEAKTIPFLRGGDCLWVVGIRETA